MEGSRHERVALIGATYVIGFVTAFIAFGVTQLEDAVEFVYVPTTQTAAVVMSDKETDATSISLTDDGLYYKVGDNEILVSVLSSSGGDDGVAAAITQYELSPDESFVYFCEQPTVESDGCKPFVYVVASEVVVPLTQVGVRIALENTPAALLWNEAGLVAIGETAVDPLPAF